MAAAERSSWAGGTTEEQAIYKVVFTFQGVAAYAVSGKLKNMGGGWWRFHGDLPFREVDTRGNPLVTVETQAQKVRPLVAA